MSIGNEKVIQMSLSQDGLSCCVISIGVQLHSPEGGVQY